MTKAKKKVAVKPKSKVAAPKVVAKTAKSKAPAKKALAKQSKPANSGAKKAAPAMAKKPKTAAPVPVKNISKPIPKAAAKSAGQPTTKPVIKKTPPAREPPSESLSAPVAPVVHGGHEGGGTTWAESIRKAMQEKNAQKPWPDSNKKHRPDNTLSDWKDKR